MEISLLLILNELRFTAIRSGEGCGGEHREQMVSEALAPTSGLSEGVPPFSPLGVQGDSRDLSLTQREKPASAGFEAVSEGFEPPVRCRTPVFEAGSFNHSDNSPDWGAKFVKFF